MNGHSAIFGPDGRLLAGPLDDEEGVLTATANLGTVLVHKMVADHGGHYARPDVFRLVVDRRPRAVASFADEPGFEGAGWTEAGPTEGAAERAAEGTRPGET
jgi:hypothetical protein